MIKVTDLTKEYGPFKAVDRISFEVGKGEIVGFLGPNGAGKTTTMRMLTGFIPATSGTAEICGFSIEKQPIEVKRRIGYLPEHPPLYREMSVHSYLKFALQIKAGLNKGWRGNVDWALEKCGLQHVSGKIIGTLSKGYQQRVGLAQAIIHKPAVLILDEPTIGLDPSQIIEIRKLIRELGGEQTVILSTHILPEVSMTCQKIIIINKGRIALQGEIGKITQKDSLEQIFVNIVSKEDPAIAAVAGGAREIGSNQAFRL